MTGITQMLQWLLYEIDMAVQEELTPLLHFILKSHLKDSLSTYSSIAVDPQGLLLQDSRVIPGTMFSKLQQPLLVCLDPLHDAGQQRHQQQTHKLSQCQLVQSAAGLALQLDVFRGHSSDKLQADCYC